MQLPKAPDNATHTSSAHGAGSRSVLHPQDVAGFVDTSPEQGMSGGAVVDLQCGLWGITESKSTFGGVGGSFVLLSPTVMAMVQAAAAVL